MAEQPTTEQPHTAEDIALVVGALDTDVWPRAEQRLAARDVLNALAAAGRLLPEGASAPVVNWGTDLGRGVIDYQARERPARLTATNGGGQVMHRYVTEWRPVSINEESTEQGADQ